MKTTITTSNAMFLSLDFITDSDLPYILRRHARSAGLLISA